MNIIYTLHFHFQCLQFTLVLGPGKLLADSGPVAVLCLEEGAGGLAAAGAASGASEDISLASALELELSVLRTLHQRG